MNADQQICRRLAGFLLLAVVFLILAPGCSDKESAGADAKRKEEAWTKGTPGNITIANQREVFLASSIRNLRAIRMALTLANHQNGQYPARLQDAEIANPDLLLSPIDLLADTPAMPLGFGSWPLDRQWKWAYDNCSYEYVPGQKEADGANILLYEKPKPHKPELPVYFMDGKAKLASAEQLTKLLEKQKATGKLDDADREPLADEPPSIK